MDECAQSNSCAGTSFICTNNNTHCEVYLASKLTYKRHLFVIHNLGWRLAQQKPKSIVPDTDDPNFYCCACERRLSCKKSFEIHLMNVHAMSRSMPNKTSLEPDMNDPNNCCQAYQKKYNYISLYWTHLRRVHQIALSPLRGYVKSI